VFKKWYNNTTVMAKNKIDGRKRVANLKINYSCHLCTKLETNRLVWPFHQKLKKKIRLAPLRHHFIQPFYFGHYSSTYQTEDGIFSERHSYFAKTKKTKS
jgi:hypothetical protein